MKLVLVDDEQIALSSLEMTIREVDEQATIYSFKKASEVLDFVKTSPCDVAFLDVEMKGINGIDLAKRLKEMQPSINIIFVTGYAEYMGEAFGLHASGYLLKPTTSEAVRKELENLRNPIQPETSRIRIQTFGNFEILVNHRPLKFRRSRAKEMLAYLVDRQGAAVSMAEIAAVMFEDRPYERSLQKQMQAFVSDLLNALKEADAQCVVIRGRNSLCVNTESFTCDYYDFIKKKTYAMDAYHGEYMRNYSWAEFTTAWLNKREL